jgi:uncharacterized lipoprotein YmbA
MRSFLDDDSMTPLRYLTPLLLALLLQACAGPQTRVHGLYLPAPEASQIGAEAGWPMLRVRLPDYLERRNLVHRGALGEIHTFRHHVWGERLHDGMERMLREQLAARFTDGAQHPPFIRIELTRFDAEHDGVLRVRGLWTARGERSRDVAPMRGPLFHDAEIDVHDAVDIVRAMSQALSALADQIAAGLQEQYDR